MRLRVSLRNTIPALPNPVHDELEYFIVGTEEHAWHAALEILERVKSLRAGYSITVIEEMGQ